MNQFLKHKFGITQVISETYNSIDHNLNLSTLMNPYCHCPNNCDGLHKMPYPTVVAINPFLASALWPCTVMLSPAVCYQRIDEDQEVPKSYWSSNCRFCKDIFPWVWKRSFDYQYLLTFLPSPELNADRSYKGEFFGAVLIDLTHKVQAQVNRYFQ